MVMEIEYRETTWLRVVDAESVVETLLCWRSQFQLQCRFAQDVVLDSLLEYESASTYTWV